MQIPTQHTSDRAIHRGQVPIRFAHRSATNQSSLDHDHANRHERVQTNSSTLIDLDRRFQRTEIPPPMGQGFAIAQKDFLILKYVMGSMHVQEREQT